MRLKSFLREPLLHFLAVGAVLFLYFHWSGGGSGPTSRRIVLTPGQIEHLGAAFARTWQRPPTEHELKGLIDDWVREEIAVREAMAAGLDRDDIVIRRRLRQKLEFLVEDAVESAPPTEAELQAWLDQHADAYATEPEVAFRQVYVSRDRRGASAASDARAILARLEMAGPDARIERMGDAIMLPPENDLEPLGEVARTFGADFATRLDSLVPGRWSGPVESSFGLHLVLVRRRVEGSRAGLAAVQPAVERDFLADRRTRQLDSMYEQLLKKYRVVIEQSEADTAASGKPMGGS